MRFVSAKYEKPDRLPENAKDAIWKFHAVTEQGSIDGLLRRVNLDGEMLRPDPDGTSWQARKIESTPWAEPAATHDDAIQNLIRYLAGDDRQAAATNRQSQDDPLNKLWGGSVSEDGLVAPVDPADMKKVCQMGRETQAAAGASGSTGCHAISMDIYESVCSPGANVTAVWYRVAMLGLCEQMGLLSRVDTEFSEAVFRVAATFPMKKMEVGVTYDGPPFDVDEFLKQVERATAG